MINLGGDMCNMGNERNRLKNSATDNSAKEIVIVNGDIEAESARSRRVHFAVMAIEASAKKLNISGQKMFSRLKKQNLINNRLIKHYESLHTQSLNWVVEDTIESLKNWEKEERTNNKQKYI